MDDDQVEDQPAVGPRSSPGDLLVAVAPGHDYAAAIAQLRRLSGADGTGVGLTILPDLASALAEPGEAPVILLHLSAVPALAAAMAQRVAPSGALAAWMQATEAALALVRRHRRRITVVDPSFLVGQANHVLAAVAARLGLEVRPATEHETAAGDAAAMQAASGENPVLTALAQIALSESAGAQSLESELEALMPGGPDHPDDRPADLADQAFATHLALATDAEAARNLLAARLPALAAELQALASERDLLLEQVTQMQQALVQSDAGATALAQQLEDARAQAAAEQAGLQAGLAAATTQAARLPALTAELKTLASERDLLLEQITQMQQALVQSDAGVTALAQQLEDARAQAATGIRAAEIEQGAREAVLGNEILRLGMVRSELLDRLETLQSATAQQLAQRDTEMASTREALADLRRELDAVYASRSWRVTAPIRRVRLALTPRGRSDE